MSEKKYQRPTNLLCPCCKDGRLRKRETTQTDMRPYRCDTCGRKVWDGIKTKSGLPPRTDPELPLGNGLVLEAESDFNLYLTSDWHAGQEACGYKELHEMVETIEADPLARVIIGGDQMEMTPPGYHDGGRDSTSHPDQQIMRTASALTCIQEKIDLIYMGNHGANRFRHVQIDPDMLLAYKLGVRYSRVPTMVQYRTPKGTVRIVGGHGKSGARNSLLELGKLQSIFPGGHLYHLGHDHNLFAEQAGALEFDDNGAEFWSGVWLCRTGSFLKYPKYARESFYQPKPIGYLVVEVRDGAIKTVRVEKR